MAILKAQEASAEELHCTGLSHPLFLLPHVGYNGHEGKKAGLRFLFLRQPRS